MGLRLNFTAGRVTGGGHDLIGPFRIRGAYSDFDGSVSFVKRYVSHPVDYQGKWDGQMIYGTWTIENWLFEDEGEFEIWPDREEEQEERALAVEELAGVGGGAPALPAPSPLSLPAPRRG
jgi:hypothetical protein